MPLFPDFTDHGTSHVLKVLSLAEFLIADGSHHRHDSFREFTSGDAITLVFAVLLHDIGMHVTEDVFLALIHGESDRSRIDGLDCQTWPELWETFIEEATRWDDRICSRIFGAALQNRDSGGNRVRRPRSNVDDWDETDCRLAGEFIRRHHPRLAHEVAVFGLPNRLLGDVGPILVSAFDSIPQLRDLAGLVARSHGASIRDVLPYLKERHFNLLESRGVHAVYLMALLRVADFMHLHAERAPGGAAQIQKLASPISRREWAAHQAIYDVRLDTDQDPEAVVIDVDHGKLDEVATYFRLREWFDGLQGEMDHSWAILGEVYGRNSRLSTLWLTLRRVKSNIDSPSLVSKIAFIPTRAAFQTSNGDFLKLLIRPLYGDRPEVGIRELLQNALDAVRERREIIRQMGQDSQHVVCEQLDGMYPSADVLISVCRRDNETLSFDNGGPPPHWGHWIEVTDRGVGMTPEIVCDYFLKAGATYRRSSAWLRTFADDKGCSTIARSGRFGIGALAAFLLGDELQVITRHYAAESGIAFCGHVDDELVELKRAHRPIGTTIRVRTSDRILDDDLRYEFHWDWYGLSDPKVMRCVHGRDIDERDTDDDQTAAFLPAENAPLPPKWRRIADPLFSDIQWSYLAENAPQLACNGIRIEVRQDAIRWHTLESNGRDWTGIRETERALRLRIPKISVFDPNGHLPLNLARNGLTSDTYPFSERLLEGVIRDLLAFALVYGPTSALRGYTHARYRGLNYPGYDNGKGGVNFTPWISLRAGFVLANIELLRWASIRRCIVLISRHKARTLPSPNLDDATAAIGFATASRESDAHDFEWPLGRWWPRVWIPSGDENPLADKKWRRILKQPVIPYGREHRNRELRHAFAELRDEVAAWTAIYEDETRRKPTSARKTTDGSYPKFTHAHQIKVYLRKNRIKRAVTARRVTIPSLPNLKPGFAVHVNYTREELLQANPATPEKGNPFSGVHHDPNQLPEFRQIERLLEGSNAAHPVVVSEKDDL